MDFKTDALVQQAIRSCFSECTVITIAHRLQTIADSDKLICMSKGRAVNIGVPYDLVRDAKSIFHELVYDLEPNERNRIIEMCKVSKESHGSTIKEKEFVDKNFQANNLISDNYLEENEKSPFLPQ